MGRGNLLLKKRKILVCLLVTVLLMGDILQPASFLKAEEVTAPGIEISVVANRPVQGTEVESIQKSASGDDLESVLGYLKSEYEIYPSQIKELVITGGQIKSSDWTYMYKNSNQFRALTDFRTEGGRGVGDIPAGDGINYDSFMRFPAWVERVEIPDGITAIRSSAFEWCKRLEELTIPSSVKVIDTDAFGQCSNLVKVNLSEGLETIGGFSGCEKLEQIGIPDSVTEIGHRAFGDCGKLKEVILPPNLITIKGGAFGRCTSLQSVTIPDHVTTIEQEAFISCYGLREVIFPKSLQSISIGKQALHLGEGGAFANCTSLMKAEIPGNVKEIGKETFSGCSSLEEIVLGEGVETVGQAAFEGTAVKNIEIPGSLKTISAYLFNKCSKLEEVTLSEGVEEIGIYAFADCGSLTALAVPASVKLLSPFAFDNCSKLSELKIYLKGEREVAAIDTHVTAEDIFYGPFEGCPAPRRMYFYTTEGLPLSDSTIPAFSDAVAAYRIEKDGDTSDNLWWGWQMEEAYSVVSHLTNLTGSNKAAVWKETDEDYTTTLTPKASAGDMFYTLPEEVVVKIGERMASPGTDYTYDPAAGTLLIKASSIDGDIEVEAAGTAVDASPSPEPGLAVSPSPTPNPTVSPGPTPGSASTPTPADDPTPVPTANLATDPTPTPIPDKGASEIADALGVSGETAQKIQEVAKELAVSKDTILVTDNTVTSQKTDKDIKGAYFARIQARASQITENNIKLVWNKVKGADGYLVYGNHCNTKKLIYEYKLAKTITNSGKRSYIKRKCKKGKYYKFIVRAYKIIDDRKVTIAVSKTVHVVTNGGKNGNAGSVRVNKGKVLLKKGKTFRIRAKEIKQKKKLQHHRKVCYESSDPKVASVSRKGIIKAKKKGKSTIYVYAQSGIYKKVIVTVK